MSALRKLFGSERHSEHTDVKYEFHPDNWCTGIGAARLQFLYAAKQIATDLGVVLKSFEPIEYESNPGEFVMAMSGQTQSGTPRFAFSINYKINGSHRPEVKPFIRADIEIEYEHAARWEADDDITSMAGHPNYLVRWAGWTIHNFNLEHNPLNLKKRFAHHFIEIYGGDKADWGLTEFELLMKGLLASNSKVTVLRLRHVSADIWYRSYSYAIWAETEKWPGLWIFFYSLAGMDSGTWYSEYQWVEQTIASLGHNVTIETFDVDERTLKLFLLRSDNIFRLSVNVGCFDLESLYPMSSLSRFPSLSESSLGKEAFETYVKAEDLYWSEDYSDALRGLRVAVQDALQNAARGHNIDISSIKDPNITKLVGILVEKGVLEGDLTPSFQAFTKFVNPSSHISYPTKEDLKSARTRMRVLATFALGRQLLREIECIA